MTENSATENTPPEEVNPLSQQSVGKKFFDPLLECLVVLTKLNGHPYSADALSAGLPLKDHRLTPQLFERAALRAGLSSKIVKRPLSQISSLILPVTLLLKNNQACILTKIDEQSCEVIFPETGIGHKTLSLEALQQQYSGFAIFTQPKYHFDKRADEFTMEKPHSWFWGTLWRFRQYFYQVVIAALLINIFVIASPLFVMNVYDRVVPNNAVETLWVLAIGISIIFIFDFLLRTLRGYLIDISGRKADTVIASLLMQQVLNIRMEAKPLSAGGFSNNLHGYEALRNFFTSATLATIIDLPFIFLFLLVIWAIGGLVVLIPLTAVPLVIIAGLILEVPMRRAVEASFFGTTQKHAILVETIGSLETIKTQSAASSIQSKWERYVGMVARAGLKSHFFSTLALNITTFIMQMVTVGVVIVGVYLISAGELSMGGLIACTILSGRALAPLSQIASLITRFQQSKMGLEGLNKIMQLPVERSEKSKFLHRPHLEGNIEFKNVTFAFPNQQINALEQVSLQIQAKEKVAILGRMGSGKSTLLKLMVGLYQPTEGSIRHDGIDIAQIDPADLRRNIGYVGQEALLFFGTVRENITMAAPWAEDANILKAAKLANVEDFVKRHPLGYDMPVGERGENLSGGQRQSLTLARALLSNPPILLLDEPTSAMDNSTEQAFLRNMQGIIEDKTLILVTHKPQLLTLVDRIIIIDEGKIVADGPKTQVLHSLGRKNREQN
jgi:ATP-binding cassette subfamily C protein LapB